MISPQAALSASTSFGQASELLPWWSMAQTGVSPMRTASKDKSPSDAISAEMTRRACGQRLAGKPVQKRPEARRELLVRQDERRLAQLAQAAAQRSRR